MAEITRTSGAQPTAYSSAAATELSPEAVADNLISAAKRIQESSDNPYLGIDDNRLDNDLQAWLAQHPPTDQNPGGGAKLIKQALAERGSSTQRTAAENFLGDASRAVTGQTYADQVAKGDELTRKQEGVEWASQARKLRNSNAESMLPDGSTTGPQEPRGSPKVGD